LYVSWLAGDEQACVLAETAVSLRELVSSVGRLDDTLLLALDPVSTHLDAYILLEMATESPQQPSERRPLLNAESEKTWV
jgi:hypothetical protein